MQILSSIRLNIKHCSRYFVYVKIIASSCLDITSLTISKYSVVSYFDYCLKMVFAILSLFYFSICIVDHLPMPFESIALVIYYLIVSNYIFLLLLEFSISSKILFSFSENFIDNEMLEQEKKVF